MLKKVQRSKKAFIMIVAVLIFCASFYYAFFMPKNISKSATPVEMSVTQDSYQEYKDYVSNANKGIKSLLEGEQLKQMKLYDSSSPDVQAESRENPFAKSF